MKYITLSLDRGFPGRIMGYRQAVRHSILIAVFVGSNPTSLAGCIIFHDDMTPPNWFHLSQRGWLKGLQMPRMDFLQTQKSTVSIPLLRLWGQEPQQQRSCSWTATALCSGNLVQLVERSAHNRQVTGSSPVVSISSICCLSVLWTEKTAEWAYVDYFRERCVTAQPVQWGWFPVRHSLWVKLSSISARWGQEVFKR